MVALEIYKSKAINRWTARTEHFSGKWGTEL